MSPNPDNVGTLEACKRLQEAGIVLETEKYWTRWFAEHWILATQKAELSNSVPAPSMAEVWRELPEGSVVRKYKFTEAWVDATLGSENVSYNPTDALIDLLIWVKSVKK